MRLLQEQGNTEQPLTCCLQRPFTTRKEIRETGEQIPEIQNILSKIAVIPRPKVTPSPGHLGSHCPSTAAPLLLSLQAPQLLCSSPGANTELRPLCRYTSSFTREISKEIAAWSYLPVHTPEQSLNSLTDQSERHRTLCHQHPRVTHQ